jgi:probable rRNA maturation factor
MASALSRWLERVAPARARGVVNVALVSDARVRALNRQFRGKDQPTDVLSFPAAPSPAGGKGRPGSRLQLIDPLGDIVISRGVARRQARRAGHAESTELRVLALHGLLHLLGYDHEDANDRGAMARLERRLRRRGGLKEGLIERA